MAFNSTFETCLPFCVWGAENWPSDSILERDLERQSVTSLDTEIFSLVEFCFRLWFKRTVKAIEEEGKRGEIMRPVSKEACLFPEGEEIWRFLEAIWLVSSQLPQGLLSFLFLLLHHAACEILVPQPGIKPVPSALEALTTAL